MTISKELEELYTDLQAWVESGFLDDDIYGAVYPFTQSSGLCTNLDLWSDKKYCNSYALLREASLSARLEQEQKALFHGAGLSTLYPFNFVNKVKDTNNKMQNTNNYAQEYCDGKLWQNKQRLAWVRKYATLD